MRRVSVMAGALALVLGGSAVAIRAQEAPPVGRIDLDNEAVTVTRVGGGGGPGGGTTFRDFAEVTRGAEVINGLFTLHKKGDHLYAEVRNDQFNQPFILPITIAKGMAQAGQPLNFGDEVVLAFKRVGDRVQVIRRNIHFKAPSGSPIEKSVQQNYVDSILMSLPIVSINNRAGGNVLIDFSDIFLTDFAQLGLGMLDRSRSSWHRVKAFPNNLELEVEATFSGGYYSMFGFGGGDGVVDPRGITLVIHYSLMKAPDGGYHPRMADDRVGHFLSATKDFGKGDPDTNFVRMVNRWRLEKADPKAELSAPKKQVIWYIEDTVPLEYRPFVESGIREWNKAFEKIGIVDAIAVRWQEPGRDEFDPEDPNYCTFRWITTDSPFAMSCLKANPLTGEMIDGDVIFDASFIKYYEQEYALLVGATGTTAGDRRAAPLAVGEVISPILAAKMGYGQAGFGGPDGGNYFEARDGRVAPEAIPSTTGGLAWGLNRTRLNASQGICRLTTGMTRDFALASLARLAFEDDAPKADDKKKDDKDKKDGDKKEDDEKKKAEDKKKADDAKKAQQRLFIGQVIKYITMHEVGHSLGLRHNFKASTMLGADQLNDTAITHAKGLVGSVMDYSAVNLAPRGKTQGDFYTTTIGPYDYWAIEYAYKVVDGSEDEELKKVAARAPEADLTYATDEDLMSNYDPQVNVWDLGADPCQFAKERIALATELMKGLDAKVVKDGESWARIRRSFAILLGQWGNAAALATDYISGQSVHRDHKGDKGARDPIVPVTGAKQRESLKFLTDQILSDKSFQFSPALLRRLGTEKWYHWGSNAFYGGGTDISVLETILATQKIVLARCLSSGTLARLQNQQLQAEPATDPLRMEEVFRSLTDGIWSDLSAPPADGKVGAGLSPIRRNLQREYLRRLNTLVLGETSNPFGDGFMYMVIRSGGGDPVPADARSLARMHLRQIGKRIDDALGDKDAKLDDTTKAHLQESRERIAKVLDATLQVKQP